MIYQFTSPIQFTIHVLYPPILMMEPSKFRPRTNRKTPPPTIPKISHFGSHVWSQLLCFNRLRAQGKKKMLASAKGEQNWECHFPHVCLRRINASKPRFTAMFARVLCALRLATSEQSMGKAEWQAHPSWSGHELNVRNPAAFLYIRN